MPYRNFMMIDAMREMIKFFELHCDETSTLRQLDVYAADRGSWRKCYSLFDDIRRKNIAANKAGDEQLQAQYSFEELCAKSLFNLTRPSAPFDPDSQFWVLPLAIELAAKLDIPNPTEMCFLTRSLGRPV